MGTVQCSKCKKNVPSNTVTFVDSTTYVCHVCNDAMKGKLQPIATEQKQYDASPTKHVQMRCQECGFVNKFRPDSKAKLICGYCGGDKVYQNSGVAVTLLQESETSTEQ